jgi:hypothetical protein
MHLDVNVLNEKALTHLGDMDKHMCTQNFLSIDMEQRPRCMLISSLIISFVTYVPRHKVNQRSMRRTCSIRWV